MCATVEAHLPLFLCLRMRSPRAQLAEALTELGRLDEATKIVSDAMHQFTGTSEEVNVLVANSQIALKKGKVDAAIRMLGNIPFTSPAYPRAQMVKADIHLKVCGLLCSTHSLDPQSHSGFRVSLLRVDCG